MLLNCLPASPHAHECRVLQVQFAGEPGHGAGVTREWLTLLAPQLFCPELGLFVRCGANPLAVLPSASESGQGLCPGGVCACDWVDRELVGKVWCGRALSPVHVDSSDERCRTCVCLPSTLPASPAHPQPRACSPTTRSTCEWRAE